jgi:putative restriction endonuclease
MHLYTGVTDRSWFNFHRTRNAEEVNFWRPGESAFRALDNGDPLVEAQLFLFRLKAPVGKIAGGGMFLRYEFMRLSEAWDFFGEGNGAATREEFELLIRPLMTRDRAVDRDPKIGCILLTNVFYLPEQLWIDLPDWKSNTVQGKTYDAATQEGARLYQMITERVPMADRAQPEKLIAGDVERFGAPTIVRPRLGQRGFRLEVTERYHRRCAMTGERSLPALEAAHIKPYTKDGPHLISNGLLLRADVHRLFDAGYITVNPELKVEVSKHLKEDFENGRDYYAMHGKSLIVLPQNLRDKPAREYVEWHNERVWKG